MNNNEIEKDDVVSTDIGLYTQTGHKLTPNEERFIQEYIKTGNATKSYVTAYNYETTVVAEDGTIKKKTSNLRKMASKVLNKAYIQEEINNRMEMLKNETIADATEILQYFTNVMRGEIKDQFGLDAPLSERTKAAQELAKRQIDYMQKSASADANEMKITLEWSRSEEHPTVREAIERMEVPNIEVLLPKKTTDGAE